MATWFLIIIYLSFISLGLPDSLLGAAWTVMRVDIGASLGAAGVISMVVSAGTIISSLISGRLIKWLGTGKITMISSLMTAASLVGYAISPSVLWLVIFSIPLGIGAGAVDAALNHYVAENYKAHHMNWLHCFWGLGATTGPMLLSYYIANNGSWRGGFKAVSIIQFSLVIILFASLPLWDKVANKCKNDNLEETEETTTMEDKNAISIRGVKGTLIAFLLYCGAESIVGLWGASFLVDVRNVSAEIGAVWVSLYYGGITVGRLITGFITLKISNKTIIRCGQIIAIIGVLILLIPINSIVSFVGFIFIGLGLAPIYPGLIHETPKRFGSQNSAKLIGYQMATAYTGTTFLPPLFGLLASVINISLFPVVVLVVIVLMVVGTESVNRAISL